MSGIVFISYRRSDAATYAGRLYDRLEARLSGERLFMDVDSIAVGEDFVRVMRSKVAECDVFLAVIGENWVEATARDGTRRLDDPDDPVRIELETAIADKKKIIPVLCGAAQMPTRDRLPESLRSLSTINALRVENERFRADMAELERALDRALADAEARRREEQERVAREAEERARLEEAANRVEAERRREAEAALEAERGRVAQEVERKQLADVESTSGEGSSRQSAQADGSLLQEQISKAEELARWDFIKGRGRVAELREHLRRWPSGITSQMAVATLETIEWATLSGSMDEAALHDFVARFPEGEHRAEAERELATLIEGRRIAAEAEQVKLQQEERARRQAADRAARKALALAEAQAPEEEQRRERKAANRGPPSPGNEIAKVERLSKVFGGIEALSNVSLGFRAGEILGVLGPSGAGKSTLLALLEGRIAPDRGGMVVGRVPLASDRPRQAHAMGIRVVHEEPAIVPKLTVAENIFIGAMPPTLNVLLDWTTLEEQTRAVLTTFGMDKELRPHDSCTRLMLAQKQMIEIMRAAAAGARLIAFDDPAASLNGDEARRLFRIIRQLKADGVSIVYASRQPNEIADLADRVAVLCDGRLITDRLVEGLTAQDISELIPTGAISRVKSVKHDPILTVSGLSSAVVRDVSLTLSRGEVLGIGGLARAERAGLARAIVGLDRRLSGEVVVDASRLRLDDVAASVAAGIGFVPAKRETEALLSARSVLDNATLCVSEQVSTAGLFDRRKALSLVGGLAAKLSMRAPNLDQPVSELAGSDQQKIVLMRWLARRPRVLILEEPTRGVDIGARVEIHKLIAELAASGIGVLLVPSDTSELIGLADRVLVIAEGRVAGELGPDADEQSILALSMSRKAEARPGARA